MNTMDLVMTGLFTAIICIISQLTIPLSPIPFSLSLFAIFLTGALLPPRNALLSVLTYILLGAFGIPVFAGYKGGIQILAGMTGGYIMAYPIMAFVTALSYKYLNKYKMLSLALGMAASLIICYLVGTLWFSYVSGNDIPTSLTMCVYPFVIFDIIKIILAIAISSVIRIAIKNIRL